MSASGGPALRRWGWLLIAAVVMSALAVAVPAPAQSQAAGGFLAQNGQRGISLVPSAQARFGGPASFDSLRKAHDLGANWVTVVAPVHTPGSTFSNFYLAPDDPTPDELAQVLGFAHSLNMRTMLQPVVFSNDGVWTGWFQPNFPDEWFANYSDMLGSYGRLAQQMQVDEFCIGTEFFNLTQPQYSAHWRSVITDLKHYYFGPLTYSANWGDKHNPEYATIDWWDYLDYIGISAYFPLSWNDFTTESLHQGWLSYTDPFGPNAVGATFHWHDAIAAVQARWHRPVQFTRIGFASYANSPGRWDLTPDPYLELSVQANGYDATMQAWADTPWLTGLFWGPWSSDPNAGGPLDNGDSPQNKPAEQVLHDWYTRH